MLVVCVSVGDFMLDDDVVLHGRVTLFICDVLAALECDTEVIITGNDDGTSGELSEVGSPPGELTVALMSGDDGRRVDGTM